MLSRALELEFGDHMVPDLWETVLARVSGFFLRVWAMEMGVWGAPWGFGESRVNPLSMLEFKTVW